MKFTIEANSMEELKEIIDKLYIASGDKEQTAPAKKEEPAPAPEKPKKAPAKKAEPAQEENDAAEAAIIETEAPAPAPTPEKKASHSESDIKVLITSKLQAGKKKQVKEVFAQWGGEKVSEVLEKNPDSWDEIYADMEAL